MAGAKGTEITSRALENAITIVLTKELWKIEVSPEYDLPEEAFNFCHFQCFLFFCCFVLFCFVFLTLVVNL